MIANNPEHLERLSTQESSDRKASNRDEEQHTESVPAATASRSRAMTQLGLIDYHPGKKTRPGRMKTPKSRAEPKAHTQRECDDGECEKVPRAGVLDSPQQPRENAPADEKHQRYKQCNFSQSQSER